MINLITVNGGGKYKMKISYIIWLELHFDIISFNWLMFWVLNNNVVNKKGIYTLHYDSGGYTSENTSLKYYDIFRYIYRQKLIPKKY